MLLSVGMPMSIQICAKSFHDELLIQFVNKFKTIMELDQHS